MSDTTTTERVERLRSVPIFAELDEAALGRILECATEFEAPAGLVLAEPKVAGSGLFVIEEGTVAVEVSGRLRDLGPGEFFGELALLTPEAVHTARVRTKTDVRGLAIARADFERLIESEPKIAVAMLRAVAARLAHSAPI